MKRVKTMRAMVPALLFLALVLPPFIAYSEGVKESSASPAKDPGPLQVEVIEPGVHVRISTPAATTGIKVVLNRTGLPKGTDKITPVANIQVFTVTGSGKGEVLTEWNDFGKGSPLELRLYVPVTGQFPCFLDKTSGTWLFYPEQQDLLQKAGFYLSGGLDATINAYVLQVTRWPAGDPPYGWGTR